MDTIHSRSSIKSSRSQKKSVFRFLFSRPSAVLAVFFLLPVYPSFSTYLTPGQGSAVGYTPDETTIIDSYEGDEFDALAAANAGFINLDSFVDNARDLRGSKPVEYIVRSGDSLSTIADRHAVSMNSILWANNLTRNSVLRAGMKLRILPVSGVLHTVEKGETLASLAKRYAISEDVIRKQNALASATLSVGAELVLPGAKKLEEPKPVATVSAKKTTKKNSSVAQEIVHNYTLKQVSNGKNFAWGNCTYFVAKYLNVTWRGNAKEWLRNAAADGVSTGSRPKAGSIIVFNGHGYNPYYGHVGIVMGVEGGKVIVKDMNFRRINEVTTRKVDLDDSAIRGYIYPHK